MRRGASILLLGCFAAGAVAQGAGCSSDDSTTPPVTGDAGKSDATVADAGSSGCSGELPPLSIKAGDGTPDLSCYDVDASYLSPVHAALLLDDGGDADTDADADDGSADAADADDGSSAVDAGEDADASEPPDAGTDSGTDSGTGQYTLQLLEFVTQQPADGVNVQLFAGKSVTGSDTSPQFFTGTTAGGGLLTFPKPTNGAKTVSFNSSGAGYFAVNLYDTPLVPPPGKTVDFTISSTNTALLVSSVLGSEPLSPTKTILVAAARDCQARDMTGGLIELVDDATGTVVTTDRSAGGARVVYFDETGLPSTTCTYTTNASQAVWSIVNAPVNVDTATKALTHSYSVRLRGRRNKDDASPVLLYQVPVELWNTAGNVVRPYKQTPPQ